MKWNRFIFPAYLIVVVVSALLVTEYLSQRINRSNGVELPFLIGSGGSVRAFRSGERFTSLDPHLGYARGDREPAVEKFRARYTWRSGFAIYSPTPDQLDRPVILTLGGSTTDALNHESSWPEELARLLVEQGIAGTVINGAAGGYSTSQELLKLIRDGIEFWPDLVISYSGVNDRGAYGAMPYPMVHRYQRDILGSLTQSRLPPILPNTIALLKSLSGGDENQLRFTLGLETERNRGEWYARNLSLMNAVSQASGADFLGVIQPSALVGNYEWAAEFEKGGKSAKYVRSLRSLYAEIDELPALAKDVHSFIDIFNGIEGVYRKDGVHTTQMGDRIIAENMLALIRSETGLLGPIGGQ